MLTLSHYAPLSATEPSLFVPPVQLTTVTRARIPHVRSERAQPPQSKYPLRPLPRLPQTIVVPMPVAPRSQVAAAATDTSAPDSDTLWQTLGLEALRSKPVQFTVAARQIAPYWSASAFETLLKTTDLERWSLLPGAKERKAALIEMPNPIVSLNQAERMPQLQTPRQYQVKPTRACGDDFERLKSAYGSRLTFHGSFLRNWHQILTQGLEPKSGTSMQANGAFKGNGLYVGLCSHLSAGFMDQIGTRVMGLVEVINHPMVRTDREALVIPSKAFARLRYLAVYEGAEAVPHLHAEKLDAFFR